MRIAKSQDGGIATEFALAFPVVMAMILGVIEIGYVAFAKAVLEGAVRDASRAGVTGFAPDVESREDFIRRKILDQMQNFKVTDSITITTRVYESFADIGEPEPFTDENSNDAYDNGECFIDINQNGVWDNDMAIAGLGGPNAVVVYEADVGLNLITPVFNWVGKNDTGVLRLVATTAVRNEPYGLVEEIGGQTEICS